MSTISREDAIEAICTQGTKEERDKRYVISIATAKQKAVDILESLPSVENVGKWIIHSEVKNIYGGIYIECSECGEKYVVQYIEDEKFCRNCGARMKGEEDDNM